MGYIIICVNKPKHKNHQLDLKLMRFVKTMRFQTLINWDFYLWDIRMGEHAKFQTSETETERKSESVT